MIKKLFTSILLCGAVLGAYAALPPEEPSVEWDSSTKTLTLSNLPGGPKFKETIQSVYEQYPDCRGQVENLIISGDFNNDVLYDTEFVFGDWLQGCASSNGLILNMSGCKGLESKYIGFSEVGGTTGDQNEQVSTTFKVEYPGMTSQTENVEVKRYFFYKGNPVDPSLVTEDENHRFTYVTGKYLDARGNIYTGTVQGDETNGYYYTGYYDIDKGVEYIGAAWNPAEGLLTEPNTGRKYYLDKNIEILTDPLPEGFNPKDILDQLKNGQTPSGYNGTGWDSEDPTIFNYYDWSESHNLIQFKVTRHYVEENHRFDLTKEIAFLSPQDAWSYTSDGKVVLVSGNDVTDKTNGDNVGSTGKYTHKVGGHAFTLGNGKGVIKSFVFPNSEKFTFVPAGLFAQGKIESVTLSENIKALDIAAFMGCSKLSSINFPGSLEQIGGDCFNGCRALTEVNLSNTKLDRVRYHTFNDCSGLTTVYFPAATLKTIQTQAFQRTAIVNLDLSECHQLRLISQKAFETVTALKTVTVCSHPKVIKGSEGAGAFNNCTNISTVEVVGCKDARNLTKCICENNAFSPDITYVQTQVESVETKGARLIFPQDPYWNDPMAAALTGNEETDLENAYMGYASAFDFFVGDYKKGVYTGNQSNIEAYYRFAPRGQHATAVESITNDNKDAYCASDNKMAGTYGIGNGWHEFMNVAEGILIDNTKDFFRTYSRTEGSGPVLLPLGITAYRAIDYQTEEGAIVKDKYNGDLWFIGDPNNPADVANTALYVDQDYLDNHPEVSVTGKPQYKYATVNGKVYLRKLHPYNTVTKSFDNTLSYVPEETGVVLYAHKSQFDESAFLIMDSYTGTEYNLTDDKYKFPHSGDKRREKTRLAQNGKYQDLDNANEDLRDNINLLDGSFGKDKGVAPVFPWNYTDNVNYTGGGYNPSDIKYRNFGFYKGERWIRLKTGILRYNRAYAKIPAAFFTNNDESEDQMPFFSWDGSEDPAQSNVFHMFGSTFEDEETDGIMTVNFSKPTVNDDAWYTLQGVKVAIPTKGIYIHKNQKVVIK